MRRLILRKTYLTIATWLLCLTMGAETARYEFRRVEPQGEWLNTGISCLLRDSAGFVWMGTNSGLVRFDGYHFKKFYARADKPTSLLNDDVTDIRQDGYGLLWMRTSLGYCVYDPSTESFDRTPEKWMASVGMEGKPERVFIDGQHNLWIAVNDRGCYFYDNATRRPHLFKMGKGSNDIPAGRVTSMDEADGCVVLAYDDGTLVKLDGRRHRRMWVNTYLPEHGAPKGQGYTLHIDSHHNYWVATGGATMIYDASRATWFGKVPEWFRAMGISDPRDHILVKDVVEDNAGRLWIATDHHGLLQLNWADGTLREFVNRRDDARSIPENTINALMLDPNGALWMGTYKNGAAYYWDYLSIFDYYETGDVNAIVEDEDGVWWLGTNDRGVMRYDPQNGETRYFTTAQTGLGTDVIVSAFAASDGSLWFGSYNGGMARYQGGRWTAYRKSANGLASDNVWSLAETPQGRIVVGTLGAGVQLLDPQKGTFQTYDHSSAGLLSDYVSSVRLSKQEKVLIAHSSGFSILDLTTGAVRNYPQTKAGKAFLSPQVNQMYEDTRGLAWIATNSGLNILDTHADQLYEINAENTLGGTVACAVTEDHHGNMWVSTDQGLVQIAVSRNGKQWAFSTINYNYLDGLQKRQFNRRSICTLADGSVAVGGQDGVNVFPEGRKEPEQSPAHVIFSGLILFDNPLDVNEPYNGRVILKEALNVKRSIELNYSDNTFTIQLASSTIVVPARKRFYYRLKGLSDKWMMTAPNRNEVTFTNLSPGTYTLEVSIVGRDGHIGNEVGTLTIRVKPPFWRSIWAFLIYGALIAAALLFAHRLSIRRQQEKFQLQQMERERERDKEMDDMKMRFFTNVSHELRTPLMLVLQPLGQMLKQESDPAKKKTLNMVHRNATRLLTLVNQLLDFRKMDKAGETLNLVTGDIVGFVRGICRSFKQLQDKQLHLTFYAAEEPLMMSFDDDKVGKIMNNLLSNAYKFTDAGGRVDVSITTQAGDDGQEDQLQIKVSDTGIGISDEDKAHIFDRFYQVKGQSESPYGGSGVGLSLTKDFVELHDGTISVEDGAGTGTAFIVHLPIRHDATLKTLETDDEAATDAPAATTDNHTATSAADHANEALESVATDADTGRIVGQGDHEVLIVDDSRDFLDFMVSVMSEHYRLRTATNGKEALRLIEAHHPDVILSDVMMPEMDGLQLCRAVKSNPETAKIPFVLLTARVAQEQKIEGMESGADDYITKPFNLDLLNLRIANLIKWRNGGSVKLEPHVKQLEITSLDEQLVNNATAFVEKNIDNTELSVEMLSSALSMSRVHLYKRLLSLTGNTPSEFIRLIRLRHAEQLLRQSQLSVAEVSYKVGFNNPRYFSKYFKEMYGMMPSQYKEANGGK